MMITTLYNKRLKLSLMKGKAVYELRVRWMETATKVKSKSKRTDDENRTSYPGSGEEEDEAKPTTRNRKLNNSTDSDGSAGENNGSLGSTSTRSTASIPDNTNEYVYDDTVGEQGELPLGHQSCAENNPYLSKDRADSTTKEHLGNRKLRMVKPKADEISEDPLPNKEELTEALPLDKEKRIDWLTQGSNYLFGKTTKEVKESKPKSTVMDKEEVAPASSTGDTKREADALYNRVSTAEERELFSNKHNETAEIRREEHILINNENYSATIKKIDVGIKVATINLEHLAEKVGVNIEKSEELVTKWDGIKKRLDDHLKSLEGIRWKKTLTYTAIIVAVAGFVYQCGLVGKLPNFAASVFSHIPVPNFHNVPKPNVQDSTTMELISKIMEKPVTLSPLNTLTGMGILFGLIFTIKALRIARKILK
jgi:hypothetical protein